MTAPKASAPSVCAVTSAVSPVPRRVRVVTIDIENVKLPTSAISAGQPTVAVAGRSATTTPAKPTTTAVHLRQPTGSRSRVPAIAVT